MQENIKHNNVQTISGVGLGLRHRHFQEIIESQPNIPWFEVHTENFFSNGSAASHHLHRIREQYPLSAHCVGMSLGSAEPPREEHLAQVKSFIERYQPSLISDHLSWSGIDNVFLPDLLPIPYTQEALDTLINNINQAQDYLSHQILIENPSSYLAFTASEIEEWDFLVTAAKRSGCVILLDINNIYVSAHNHSFDALSYINSIPTDLVQEIHLAGFSSRDIEGQTILIDDHGAPVHEPVWALYRHAIQRFPNIPTLIEWDTDVPDFNVLIAEKNLADTIIADTLKNKKIA